MLAFKGGTALKRCYFGDYRFSEDLDFTLTKPVAFDELIKRLEPDLRRGAGSIRHRLQFRS